MRPSPLFVSLAVGLHAAAAHAVPLEIPTQGRLLDADGVPLDGPTELTFSLYAGDATEPSWTDVFTVDLSDGYYAVALGSGLPLDEALFDADALSLGIAVDDDPELSPRRPLASVPFAVRAGAAEVARDVSGGVVDASEIRIGGELVVDGDGNLVGTAVDTLSGLDCAEGETVTFDGAAWGCAPALPVHAHDAADVTSGTIAFGVLPVGDTEGTVAAGDHVHGFGDLTDVLPADKLPVDLGDRVDAWVTDGPLDLHPETTLGGNALSTGPHFDADDAVAAMGDAGPDNPLHHARYTDAEAVAAVAADLGEPDPGDPRNHARYTDSEAVDAMGQTGPDNPLNHARYTDSEAVAAVSADVGAESVNNPRNHARYTDDEAVSAMGDEAADNPLNHARYTDAEAVAAVSDDVGAESPENPRNHARYTDDEAVSAMGGLSNTNPLNHSRYTDADAVAAVAADLGAPSADDPRNHARYTDEEAVAAMGDEVADNPLNHARYTDAQAISAVLGNIGPESDDNTFRHDRYTDDEAVTAMGVLSPTNPLNHARFTADEAVAAMGAPSSTNPLNHPRFTAAEVMAAIADVDWTWKLVHQDIFSYATSGWTDNTLTTCPPHYDGMLGGYGVSSGGTNDKVFSGLPDHSELRIVLDFHFIDSWDHEDAFLRVDGEEVWTMNFRIDQAGSVNACGRADWHDTMGVPVEVVVPHTGGSFTLSVGSRLDSAPEDESWAIDNLRIYVR